MGCLERSMLSNINPADSREEPALRHMPQTQVAEGAGPAIEMIESGLHAAGFLQLAGTGAAPLFIAPESFRYVALRREAIGNDHGIFECCNGALGERGQHG